MRPRERARLIAYIPQASNPAFAYSVRDMVLINPKVYLAADEAGSFDFTMPKNHIFYDAIIPYGSTIAVKEDDSIIFKLFFLIGRNFGSDTLKRAI